MKQLLTILILTLAMVLNTKQTQAQCYSAVELDGVNDYMFSPFNNYYFANYTIEMWINSVDYTQNDVYVNFNHNAYVVFGGWAADGSFDTGATGQSPLTINSGAGTTPANGTWHHVATVYDGITRKIYIDGVLVKEAVTGGSVTQGTGATSGLGIGARFDGSQQFTRSSFEDIRIWSTARTAAELNANMSTNLVGFQNGLVAYYRFEDGAGSTTVTDLSGNGNTLTLMNMDPATDWVTGPFSTDVQTTDVQASCGPLTWIDGVTYTSNNNTATYTFVGGAAGGCDSIVTLDLTINSPTQSTDVQTACNSYTWVDGITYTANNNSAVYTEVGGAANGCDNIITLDLTINTADATVTTTGNDITANLAGAQYQWIDCNNGFVAIPGETSQTFTATTTGFYAVIVTAANGCSDTSACQAIEFASLNESNLVNGLTVSPNPTNGEFSISTVNYSGEVTIEVVDITGKLIYNSTKNLNANSSANIDLTNAANGVYIVKVSDLNDAHSIRVVKK